MTNETSSPAGTEPVDARHVAQAKEALARGALAGLPTEVGFAVASRADGQGLARLRELVRARADAIPTIALAEPADADPWVSNWIAPAARLRRRYWPGPLVLLLPSAPSAPKGITVFGDSWVPLRVPANAFTRAVLQAVPLPIAILPAALPGAPIPARAAEIRPEIASGLGYVSQLSGGALGQGPAVARVGPGVFEVLGEGILTGDDLRRTAGLRILLVCTGNTCRSPMAEAWLRARLVERLGGGKSLGTRQQIEFLTRFGYRVESAGVGPMVGAPATPNAVAVAAESQLSIEDHRAREATPELEAGFDRVFAMSDRHLERLLELDPNHPSIERLSPGMEIDDPYGAPIEIYRSTMRSIAAAIERRLPEL